jgi:uncharacterized protein HemY
VHEKLSLPVISEQSNKQEIKALEVKFAQLALLTQQGQIEQADILLEKMHLPLLKQTPAFQQLWMDIKLAKFDWVTLDKYIVKLNKQIGKQLSNEAYVDWQSQQEGKFTHAFEGFLQQQSINQLQQAFKSLSKAVQHLSFVQQAYLNALFHAKQPELVEPLLNEQFGKRGSDWLLTNIRRYFNVAGTVHMDELFTKVQKKAGNAADDKALLTVYAYLASGQKDHQLAKQALEQVIYTNHNALDNKLYAITLAELGEVRRSIEVFRAL